MTMPPSAAPDGSDAFNTEVLVVDDDIEVRDLLVEHVRSRGMRVSAASDGRAAIDAIHRAPAQFGLIFSDLNLPGADGLEVLRAARQSNPTASVVIITGYASLDSAVQAVRLGAYDYLTKPFLLGQIDVILQRLRDRHALEQENRRLLHRLETLDGSSAAGGRGSITARLDAIELALRDLTSELRRQPR